MPQKTPAITPLGIVAALACLLLLSGCERQEEKAFESQMREYLLAHPEVIQEAAVKLKQKQAAAIAAVLKDPDGRLGRDPRDFVANPNGGVTVVQFFDYGCTYSRAIAPEVLKLIAQNPDVRFVFKEYPVFGSASDMAAKAALTPQGKARGLELYRSFMSQKTLSDARLDGALRGAGLNPQDVRAAARDPAIEKQIRDTRALAQEINVKGTPTFVVGGQAIQGADIEKLREAIVRARSMSYQALAGARS